MPRLFPALAAVVLVSSPCLCAAATDTPPAAQIQGEHLRVEFDRTLRSRIIARFGDAETPLGPFVASETVVIADKTDTAFPLISQKADDVHDAFGAGRRLTVTGQSSSLRKEVSVIVYDDFPAMAFFDVQYTNTGKTPLALKSWTNNAYTINAQPQIKTPPDGHATAFWSYQSGSYEKRPNWVLPLHTPFHQENYLGMNASDYGGGTPVVDVWRRDVGIAVGHVEPHPKLISLPVSMPNSTHATLAVTYQHPTTLGPGESLHTFRTFASVHQGDYFRTLADYRRFMMKQGFQSPAPPITLRVLSGARGDTDELSSWNRFMTPCRP